MWEQAQKNRHRTLTFTYGGGVTGILQTPKDFFSGPFASHLLHHAHTAPSEDTVPTATPEPEPQISIHDHHSDARASPISQGKSTGRASTERSIENAISLANSKLASSRRGGLLSAVRDEPSTRATSSKPLVVDAVSPELIENFDELPNSLFEPEASPSPPPRFGSGGLARNLRVGSAGRVTFQSKSTRPPSPPKPFISSPILASPILSPSPPSLVIPHHPRKWEPLGVIALSEKTRTLRPTLQEEMEVKRLTVSKMRPRWMPGKPVFNNPFEEPSAAAPAADLVAMPGSMRVWTGETDYEGYN
ncbi:hypothetical protein BC829DRAFT_301930 [Chytridium lagenaria]|nr:hypothetical protein BC829DRAFT_301930 [Chytridium lagenaria]